MHLTIAERRSALAELCRRFGVARLDLFGSATDAARFSDASDVDFLVEFGGARIDLARFEAFRSALEALLSRHVDLIDRRAVETSRNYIRRRHILSGAETVYAA